MKRIVQFNHLFLMTATMLTIASCGPQKNRDGVAGFSASTAMSATRNLTDAERTIATRICYAYQSKNTSFKTQTYYGGTFTFNMAMRSCQNQGVNELYTIAGVLQTKTDGSLYYNTTSTKAFEPKVQTSNSGFLASLCSKIQNNVAISNTAVVENVTVQVAFTSTDLDTYTLNYFSKVGEVMKIQSAETFKVRTQFNQNAGQILGMDEIYTKQAVCAQDATKVSTMSQTYVGYVPQ